MCNVYKSLMTIPYLFCLSDELILSPPSIPRKSFITVKIPRPPPWPHVLPPLTWDSCSPAEHEMERQARKATAAALKQNLRKNGTTMTTDLSHQGSGWKKYKPAHTWREPGEKWNNGCRPHQSSFCEKLVESPFKKTKSWLHGSSKDTGEMAMSGTRNIIDTFWSFKNYFPIYRNHKSTANIGDGIGKELNPISFDRGGQEDLEVNSKKIFIWILVKF